MKLQGRDLQLNMRAEDVKLMQAELRRFGFTITAVEGLFGPTTLRAVQKVLLKRPMCCRGRSTNRQHSLSKPSGLRIQSENWFGANWITTG